MSATAAARLADAREHVTIEALSFFAALAPDPGPALDTLAAIAPAQAEILCARLADRDDTTPAAIRAKGDLWRLDRLAEARRLKAAR